MICSPAIRRFTISFIVGALMISGCRASGPDRATPVTETPATSQANPAEVVEPAPAEPIDSSGVQQQTAGGIMLEASNMRFEEDETGGMSLKLDVCFPMPTNADWGIYAASLSYSGSAVTDHGIIPIEIVEVGDDGTALVYTFENNQFATSERPAFESEVSRRCDTLYFWGLPEEVREVALVITIPGLYASRNTGQPCTAELLARAQMAIDAFAEGIILACTSDDANGYAGLAIEGIPEGTTREAVDAIFYSSDFYLAMFGVAGPWVFVYSGPSPATSSPVPAATSEPRTLTVCMGAEPATLYIYGGDMHAMRNVLSAIYDGPIDPTGFAYEPVILEKLPSLADGDALIQTAVVSEGDPVLDADGAVRLLTPGVRYRPAGCRSSDCALEYADGTVEMDHMVVRFSMLAGLLWSDGHPLTAGDSVFSFQTASSKCDHPWDASLEMVDCGSLGEGNALQHTAAYTMLDERTVEWVGIPGFLDPYYQTNFAHPLPAHQLGAYTAQDLYELEEARTTPLGWGPYRITAWNFGEEIRMERNPYYHRASEGLPKFDFLVFRMIGGEERNIDMLLSGSCDILDLEASIYLDFETLMGLQDAGELALDFGTGTVWEHVDFGIRPFAYDDGYQPGVDRPDFFGDVRTRQAIAHCIDRGAIEDQVLGGFSGGISTSFVPDFHPLANPDTPTYPFDPAAGAALLEAAGWIDDDGDPATSRVAQGVSGVPDGSAFTINFWTTMTMARQLAAEIIKNSLASCGIEANLAFRESGEFFREEEGGAVFGRGFDLAEFAWFTGAIPPCDLYLSENIPGPSEAVAADGGQLYPAGWSGANTPGFSNAEYDRACLAALALLPGEPGFIEAHQEAQAIFARELPVIPLYLRVGPQGFFTVSRPDLCHHSVDSNGTDFRHIEAYELGSGCR